MRYRTHAVRRILLASLLTLAVITTSTTGWTQANVPGFGGSAFITQPASSIDPLHVALIFVTFPEVPFGPPDPDLQSVLDETRATTMPNALEQSLTWQSLGTTSVTVRTILNPADPSSMWLADYPVSDYANGTAPSTNCAVTQDPILNPNNDGIATIEILDKIAAAYAGTGTDPFEGVTRIGVIWATNMAAGGGTGILNIQGGQVNTSQVPPPGCLEYLDNYVGFQVNQGNASAQRQKIENRIVHEMGHSFGFGHPGQASGSPLHFFQNAAPQMPMQAFLTGAKSGGLGAVPFIMFHLQMLGWYEPPTQLTGTTRDLFIPEIRATGRSYFIDVATTVVDPGLPGERTMTDRYYFAYHGGINEDAQLTAAGNSLYQSPGLAVWAARFVERTGANPSLYARLASAWGRSSDPGPDDGDLENPAYWNVADPIVGHNNYMKWTTRSDSSFFNYEGSPRDFFDSGDRNEFSFRSNPSSWTPVHPDDLLVLPRDQPNSLVVRIKEEVGSGLTGGAIVDVLLAPEEEVLTPNSNTIATMGGTLDVTWASGFSWGWEAQAWEVTPELVIDAVDIHLSLDNGETYTVAATGLTNDGSATFALPQNETSTCARVKLVFHNIYTAHTGESVSESFSIVQPGGDWLDVASGLLADVTSNRTAAWGDFDSDGDDDLFVASLTVDASKLFRNDAGDLNDVTDDYPGLENGVQGVVIGASWSDSDGDGDLDLFLSSPVGGTIWRNDQGSFASVSSDFDDADARGHDWADYDGDGDVDAYVSIDLVPNLLLRNDGNNAFETLHLDASGNDNTSQSTWIDYNNDLLPDLYEVNTDSPSRLFKNEGAGQFSEVLGAGALTASGRRFASTWGDYDDDGDADVYITTNAANLLLRNDGGDTFSDVTVSPLDGNSNSRGAQWVDSDNDGDLDLYVVNQGPNELLRNDGGSFSSVSNAVIQEGGDGFGGAWNDFDEDGDVDVYVTNANSNTRNALLLNNGSASGNNWIRLALLGQDGGPTVGARVRYKAATGGWRTRFFGSGLEYMAQHGNRQLLGLGQDTEVEDLTVVWPDGKVSRNWFIPEKAEWTLTEPIASAPFGEIAMSFSATQSQQEATIAPFVPFDWYVTTTVDFGDLGLEGLVGEEGISAWELGIDLPPGIATLSTELLPSGSTNLGSGNDYLVAAPQCIDTTSSAQVIHFTSMLVQSGDDLRISLRAPGTSSTAEGPFGPSPAWTYCASPNVIPFEPTWASSYLVLNPSGSRAPEVAQASIGRAGTVNVIFTEQLDQTSAETAANFIVRRLESPPVEEVVSSARLLPYGNTVKLILASPIQLEGLYEIEVLGVANQQGIVMAETAVTPILGGTTPQLVVNEIMHSSAGIGDPAGEWIEIWNRGTRRVDLFRWVLDFGGVTDFIDASESITILPQDYALLARDAAALAAVGVTADMEYGSFMSLEGVDSIKLISPSGAVADEVSWDATWPSGTGASLQWSGIGDNGLASQWHVGGPPFGNGDFGTPGAVNAVVTGAETSPGVPGIQLLGLFPNPFNPSVSIRFRTSEAGRYRVAVFDVRGRLVATPHDRLLLSGEHEVRWDGRSATGREVASGVYFFEIANERGTSATTRGLLLK